MLTLQKIEEIKENFDSLGDKEQWEWLIKTEYKSDIVVTLDNDNTSITFNDDKECDYLTYFKDDIGSRSGVNHILQALGINVQNC